MRRLWISLTIALLAAALPAPSTAATGPDGGTRFVGRTSLKTHCFTKGCRAPIGISFDVSEDARSLPPNGLDVPTGSRISSDGTSGDPCTGLIDWEFGKTDGMVIKSNGRFRAVAKKRRRGGRATLVVAGRFSRDTVRGSVSIVRRGGRGGGCANAGSFTARRQGSAHFVEGSCTPPDTRTLLDDGRLRVFEDHGPFTTAAGSAGHVVYGCDRQAQRRYVLDTHLGGDHPERVGPFVTAGDFVAWGSQYCEPFDGATECFYSYVTVVDLRRGKVAGGASFGSRSKPPQIVLKPNGSFAWIACNDGDGDCTVGRSDSRGAKRLDLGPDLSGLTLSGSTLSWMHGTTAMTADLL